MIAEKPSKRSVRKEEDLQTLQKTASLGDARAQACSSQPDRHKQEKTRLNQRVKDTKMATSLSKDDSPGQSGFLDQTKIDKMKAALLEIHTWTAEVLKDALRKNQQSTSGSKLDLLTKVADGKVFGRTPRCSVCHKGHLKMDFSSGTYYCAGFHEGNTHWSCKSSFLHDAVQRQPWAD